MDAPERAVTDTLIWVWDKQSLWSQAATNMKLSLFRARTTSLWLTLLAAILATLAVQIATASDTAARVLSGLAALAMGLVALSQTATSRGRVQNWTRARSVSEALKAEAFTFLAGVAPYRGANREQQLRLNVDQILESAADLTACVIGLVPEKRRPPEVSDISTYASARVQQQVAEYYRPMSAAMKRRADLLRLVEIVLAIAALVLSFGTAVTGWQALTAWSPVITTIVAAVAAHTAVHRYDALALEYARTYEQLERLLLNRSTASVGPQRAQVFDDEFVAAAERVISIQNEAWMSRNVAAATQEQGAGSSPGSGAS